MTSAKRENSSEIAIQKILLFLFGTSQRFNILHAAMDIFAKNFSNYLFGGNFIFLLKSGIQKEFYQFFQNFDLQICSVLLCI